MTILNSPINRAIAFGILGAGTILKGAQMVYNTPDLPHKALRKKFLF